MAQHEITPQQYFDAKFEAVDMLDERIASINTHIASINAEHAALSEYVYTMSGQLDVV